MRNARALQRLIFGWICLAILHPVVGIADTVQTADVEIVYEKGTRPLAEEALRVYPAVRAEIERTFSWNVDFRPTITFVRDRQAFQKTAGSDIYAAYAVPQRYLIVIDAAKATASPFTVRTTLEHEMCHLLIHRHITKTRVPRWLEEGVCQWASRGLSELTLTQGERRFSEAVLADSLMRFSDLWAFPEDEASIVLAYEQSKRLIEYISSRYGSDTVRRILDDMREGYDADASVQKNLSLSLSELERDWRADLKRRHPWYRFVSDNIYLLLFLIGAMITLYGFLRFVKKKREYVDDGLDDDGI